MKYLKYFIPTVVLLLNFSFSQDFDVNQSQQQAVYFIDSATFDGADVGTEDYVLARTASGLLVGSANYNGYGTDLVVMGRDQDVVADGNTYIVCETTGTCDYPVQGDNVLLTIFDTSLGQEFTPFSISQDGTSDATANPQAVEFSTLINEQFVSVNIATDCSGQLGGDTVTDECGTCGGSGVPDGECDCSGNVLDECGTCGGSGIPDGECDCSGNVIDCAGICGGDTT